MPHLLAFDWLPGPLGEDVVIDGETIVVGARRLWVPAVPEPADLPWRELDVGVMVESTGRFARRDLTHRHLDARVRTILISAVANDADVTIVPGLNDDASIRPATASCPMPPARPTA